MANIIKFRRKKYTSYMELSRDYPEVPYSVLVYRIRSGWPLEKAVLPPQTRILFTFRDKEYTSYKALSRDYPEVPYHLLLKRINSGCTLEEAVLPPQTKVLFTFRDKEYTSYKDLARDYPEIPYHWILERINSGCTLDEAVLPKRNKKTARVVTYKGEVYPSIVALARHLGLGGVDLRECFKRYKQADVAVERCFRRVEERKRLEEENK